MKKRTFILGSEWVYVKLYTGCRTADKLLINNVFSIIKQLKRLQLIEKWFFIRYSDPDFHLRIRFLLKDKRELPQIISIIHIGVEKAVKNGMVWKVQFDTYNRELERYDPNLIEETESIFFRDSECILSIISKLEKLHNENYRWMIALSLIDQFLSDFSFDLSGKLQWADRMSDAYKIEFGFNKYNSKQFNHKFRENRNVIESVLRKTIADANFSSLYSLIERRTTGIKSISNIMRHKVQKCETISIEELTSNHIHMTMNRLFRYRNRAHELVLYDFLRRFYVSEIAQVSNPKC